ncbi:phosphoenolpyruvate synthase [Cocleimonas sp. KMM 6892]|uniref:phosphoenolpyruvate synthase n=1 Tax=unclassified Cocleimonas TaxID=2639732 RepID=UPI002DB976EB|nr:MULTISPECIES: phosphoenolpyruvate synthase [unclassified Cocleimonas]MEB8432285.1 phosphoenolpyruvate synthase [Cocleimonas sp. KMM 6892]MEC4714629.1 phosphoenolpyruvate synthase [Cocleimonas sp. KMM 6895]MEC4744557.1 phosphoenolpyruvate synthase [Cocleimonas sp. KMM 6896]
MNTYNVIWLDQLGINDIESVGGKNASLGEMIQNLGNLGVNVPGGFATTADAYRGFLEHEDLGNRINALLDELDVDNLEDLARTGKQIRDWIMEIPLQDDLEKDINEAYEKLVGQYGEEVSWAVRSSATAEDLPDASFAGQQETFLNVSGIDDIKIAIRKVFASLFTDRAISYRVHQNFDHAGVALSAGIQKMVRSDIAASGVMFTLDTESGCDKVVFVTGSYGLGEMVVQGAVNPDEFYVYKKNLTENKPAVLGRTLGSKKIEMIYDIGGEEPVKIIDVDESKQTKYCITDAQVEELARQAITIEKHYKRPMDIEWALDGNDGGLYIVQARPETVQSQATNVVERFALDKASRDAATVLAEGRSIGSRVGAGKAKIIMSLDDMDQIQPGDVLVTDMTDPDWEPIMKRASAIVTNRGGRTCHAAIIARELGVPAVVGCGDATKTIVDNSDVTVSCAEGDTGYTYEGLVDFEVTKTEINTMPELDLKVMMNVGNPERAFDFCQLPNEGIGLARMEFIINNMIGIHPRALLEYDKQSEELKAIISPKIEAYESPRDFFVQKIIEGVSTLAAAFAPKPVILRMSDFKSNEYANLIGGTDYEPHEENPMIGFRGAARYIDETFRPCFEMECEAIKYVRDVMGLTNIEVMIPFVRTLEEAKSVTELLAANGLGRGENGLRHIMMCELPSNAVLANKFLEYFDGFSIGSNDMTQLTLGLDRDSGLVAESFDERNPAVKKMLKMAIKAAKKQGKYVGICGQGPSDHPDLAEWLMKKGIDSVSLNPDTVIETWKRLAAK